MKQLALKPSIFLRRYLALYSALLALSISDAEELTEQWEVFGIAVPGESLVDDPFAVELSATFVHEQGEIIRVPGFYNGGREWVIRFSPSHTGEWNYQISSSIPALAGGSGTVRVVANTNPRQHGPIVIPGSNRQHFAYADGTPYNLMAFEIDWLFALDAENPDDIPRTRQMVSEIAKHGFNQVVMNVYAYGAGFGEKDKIAPEHNFARPQVFPFGGDNNEPDFDTLDI
ncbi:MAG: DUF5060 domain-containing protein, partial [Verrucomicrobiota bacterium]